MNSALEASGIEKSESTTRGGRVIRVAVLDSSNITRNYLEALLSKANRADGIYLVGTYDSYSEALKGIRRNKPEVIILDLSSSTMTNTDAIKWIRERFEAIEILIYSKQSSQAHILSALKAGASGYLLKGVAGSLEIIDAIKEIIRGGAPMSPAVARCVIAELSRKNGKPTDPLLSRRQQEVLAGIADGRSEKMVAVALGISPHTIHTHVKKILGKLKVHSKLDAILKAKEKGLL